MATVRVMLAALPNIIGDIVRHTLSASPDLAVLAEVASGEEAMRALRRTEADVLIVGSYAPGRDPSAEQLLREHPRLRLITLTGDGRAAYVYELEPRQTMLGEPSPRDLLDAVLSARGAG